MPQYRVKLVSGAFEKAQGADTNIGFFETEERFKQRVEGGYVQVGKREYDRLRLHGLIADAEVDPQAQGRNAPDEDDHDHRGRRVARTRDEGVVSAVPIGGVGHQAGDNYSNQRIQEEAARDQAAGLKSQKDRGLPDVRSTQSEQALRSDHSLPEQEKAFRDAEAKRDKELEQAQDKAEKERERERKAQERENAKAERKQAKRAEKEQAGDVDDEGVAKDEPKTQSQEQDKDQEKSPVGAVKDDGQVKTTTTTTTKTEKER